MELGVEHITHLQWGKAKGRRTTVRRPDSCFLGFFNSMESAFSYEESFSVRPNPVRRRRLVSGDPDGLSSGPTWCLTARKALCLRLEAPRLSSGPSLRRPGRGASLPAKPYSFVRRHHVYRPGRASGDPDVVLHCPQSLMPSSGSTTSIVRAEPPATRTWCFTVRKALFLRPEAPRHLVRLSLRRLGRGASPSAKPYAFVRKHHACWLGPPAPQLASPFSQNLNSSSGHAKLARPSLRQPGLPFSHKKRMRRTYII